MKKIITISAILASAMVIAGCSNKYGAAYIITEPAGAEVINLDDGTTLGITPIKQVWQDEGERKQINLQISRQGYRPKSSTFWLTLGHHTKGSALNAPQYVEVKLYDENGNGPDNTNANNGDIINVIK